MIIHVVQFFFKPPKHEYYACEGFNTRHYEQKYRHTPLFAFSGSCMSTFQRFTSYVFLVTILSDDNYRTELTKLTLHSRVLVRTALVIFCAKASKMAF